LLSAVALQGEAVSHASRNFLGFTLVESLVVIAIIGVLVGLLLPAVPSARESARKNQCSNNLEQICLAAQWFHDSKSRYPAGRNGTDEFNVSWAFQLLQYLEGGNVFSQWKSSVPPFEIANGPVLRIPVGTFHCPSRREPSADRDFIVGSVPKLLAEATSAVGERHVPPEPVNPAGGLRQLAQSDNAFCSDDIPFTILSSSREGLAKGSQDTSSEEFGSEHSGISRIAFLDSHVQLLSHAIELLVLQSLTSIGDGKVIAADQL